MNKHLITVILSVIVAACSSGPSHHYFPANTVGELGFTQRMLTQDKYQVSYTTRASTAPQTVNEFTLLRAAEVTLEKGYQWFQVLDSDTQKQKTQTHEIDQFVAGSDIVRDCGLLGCSTYRSPAFRGHHIHVLENAGLVTSRLQISMGKGQPADPQQVFNAKELAENLRPLLTQ